jgi:hypothetical protein
MYKRITGDMAISGIIQFLRRIFKAIQDYSYEVFGQFGITGPQFRALKAISKNEGLPLGREAGSAFTRFLFLQGQKDFSPYI